MNKTNIQRLLHTLLPFMIMTMVQRSFLLIFGHTGLSGETADFLAFLPACLSAALLFRIRTYMVEDEDGHTETLPLEPKPVFLCILQTLFACGIMIGSMYIIGVLLGDGTSDTPEISLLALLSILLVHPLAEELLFRKMFYGELRLMNPIFGCIAQALMFAIVHNTVDGMIYALCSGVVLAVLYENSGRIFTSIAAHIVINLRSYLCLTVLAEHDEIAKTADIAFLILSGAAFIGIAVLEGRRIAAYDSAEESDLSGKSDSAEGDSHA